MPRLALVVLLLPLVASARVKLPAILHFEPAGGPTCRFREVAKQLPQQKKEFWRTVLPDHMQAVTYPKAACEPSGGAYSPAIARLPKRIVVADESGLAVLDDHDGKLLLDGPAGANADPVRFESVTAVLRRRRAQPCERSATGPVLAAKCGDAVLVVNGAKAALVQDRPLAVRHETPLKQAEITWKDGVGTLETTLGGNPLSLTFRKRAR